MNTVVIDDQNVEKPKLVLMHGYGSSTVLMYKIFKPLSEHFQLYCVDALGLGASDRPENYSYECSADESLDYFLNSFE